MKITSYDQKTRAKILDSRYGIFANFELQISTSVLTSVLTTVVTTVVTV